MMKHALSRSTLGAALSLLLLSACSDPEPVEPPPVPVRVYKVEAQDKPLSTEYIGEIRAQDEVAVFPRVAGTVVSQRFREGALVKQGQVLFTIDAQEYVAARDVARAQLASALAQSARANDDVARYEPLVAEDAIARQIYDNAVSTAKANAAQVDAARASLRNTEIALSYSQVRAPISGRIGKASVSVGQLVAPGQVELARISNSDEIEVYFSPSEDEVLRFNSLPPEERAGAQSGVKLVLSDGTILPQTGTIDFADRAIDPLTGSYSLRAVFPNPGQQVRPGQFGRVQIQVRIKRDALSVPDRAVIEQFGSYFVMVVGEDNLVEQRQVKVGVQAGGEWIIEDGLSPGETVIVEGLSKVRQGSAVQPLPPLGSAPDGAARPEASAPSTQEAE
ncbi:MAG: efflux RND transporter periplasmic adaptor subunit [Erythrobacter sp.]|uniref:efflux RND transporter periplasmic adaptor subunit n=1 Tax=Erythrobacter sp. TaxID=1042 RepID=UPI00262D3585|nr:efflux RND transporter periplasmic adaptor subunit [Erythrobacter sp.]MDJ0978670.1 efflux RND transporter periplasmic adaptor subunit [Erythrobacter sp.]